MGEDGKMQGMEWTGNSRWMPVTIGLVGSTFHMQALGPTLRLTSPFVVGRHPADMASMRVKASTCVECKCELYLSVLRSCAGSLSACTCMVSEESF